MAEAYSVFDIFKIGIGPSSSHTVGPMKAARAFAESAPAAARIRVTLHGSLAWTGKGHGTDVAIFLGLAGETPETVNPDDVAGILERVRGEGRFDVEFNYERELDRHTNGMHFEALDGDGNVLLAEDWYSLGGGFIARGDEPEPTTRSGEPPFTYSTSESLLSLAAAEGMTIAELVLRN